MSLSTHVKTSAGVMMPRMIYGTAWKKERTADLVEQAFKLGFRGVDTACQVRPPPQALSTRHIFPALSSYMFVLSLCHQHILICLPFLFVFSFFV